MNTTKRLSLAETTHSGNQWRPFADDASLMELYLEVPGEDEPAREVAACWTESLQWHEDYLTTRGDGLVDDDGWLFWHDIAAPETPFDPDAPWWLTDDAMSSIAAVIRGHLPDWARSVGVLVDVNMESGGDTPNFTVEVNLPGVTLESSVERCLTLAHDVAATVANLTDPGTFGVPYLFHEVRRDLGL